MTPDHIERAPDLTGPRGRAWRIDMDAYFKTFNISEDDRRRASIAGWIIEAPWAHPFWHSYAIGLLHLRPHPDHAPVINRPGATHEFWLHAMNPKESREPIINATGAPHLLLPANFAAQLVQPSDEDAIAYVESAAVKEIVEGRLSPDTDFARLWIERFGDYMIVSATHDASTAVN